MANEEDFFRDWDEALQDLARAIEEASGDDAMATEPAVPDYGPATEDEAAYAMYLYANAKLRRN